VTPDDPAQFYTGLVAELYGPLRSTVPDPEPYAFFIARSGEPALELGCGNGDPILELRARGIEVEGLDSSADMLDRCRRAALERGIDVVLHEQPMQTMDLGRRYRSIYLAGPTFNLLADDAAASATLERVKGHLLPGGSALIPLFVPAPTPAAQLGKPRMHTTDAGVEMRVTFVEEHRDEPARLQVTIMRYERIEGTEAVSEDRTWRLHWYTQDGFRELATEAGLDVAAILAPEGGLATADADTFVFLLRAPPPARDQ
jgi:SAM-dependent methyltransferase